MSPKVKVLDDNGRVKILLLDGQSPVAMASMTWADYANLSREVFTFVLGLVYMSISKKLPEIIWQHAQLASDNSAELAKERLTKLNFNGQTIDQFAAELAREAVQALIDRMPEHT